MVSRFNYQPFLRKLVGNPGAYARQADDGTWYPVREPLDMNVIRRHLLGEMTVGTYVLHGEQARTLVFDIDQPSDLEVPAGDMEKTGPTTADLIELALDALGVAPRHVGLEFSGRKGHHVWVVLPTYVPAKDLRRLGRAVLMEAGVRCEVFPKQDKAIDLGNLVKLPGGVHRVTGRRAEFIGALPVPLPVPVFNTVLDGLPATAITVSGGTRPPSFHCMDAIQDGVTEGGRNISLYHLAIMCRRGGLNPEFTEMVVRGANERANPPLDESQVQDIVRRVDQSGPLCNQLPPDLHCGDNCMLNRMAGLYTRPGQVAGAAEGEKVVLTLASRAGRSVQFEHDDLVGCKGALK